MVSGGSSFIGETRIPKIKPDACRAKHIGIGKLMRPKFQKQSALKLAGRIIPYKQGYNTPLLALGFIPVVEMEFFWRIYTVYYMAFL